MTYGIDSNREFTEARWSLAKEALRHPSSQRFHDVLAEWGSLHDAKQRDYGGNEDPFRNVRASEDFGIPAWVGAILRASDKMRRLEKAARQVLDGEEVAMANESIIDSFDDLGVYSGIARVLYEEEIDQ